MGVWAYRRVGVSACRRMGVWRGAAWIVAKNPVIFVSARGRPEIALNKRLPRTFQGVSGELRLKPMKISERLRWAKHRVR